MDFSLLLYHSIVYFEACGICGGVFNILFLYFIGTSKINYYTNTRNSVNLLIFMGSKCSLVQCKVFTYYVKFLQNTDLTESSNGSCIEFTYGGACKSTLECCTTPKRLVQNSQKYFPGLFKIPCFPK